MTKRVDRIEAMRAERDELQRAIAEQLRRTWSDVEWEYVSDVERSYWLHLAGAALEVVDARDNGLLDWLQETEGLQRECIERFADEMAAEAERLQDGENEAAESLGDFARRLRVPIQLPDRIRR